MAYLIRMPRAAWRRQPSGSVEVHTGNPITQGLLSLYAASNAFDLVMGRPVFGYKNVSPYYIPLGATTSGDLGQESPTNAALATYINGNLGLTPSSTVTFMQLRRLLSSGTYSTSVIAGWIGGSSGFFLRIRYSTANFYPFAGSGLEHVVSLKDDQWHLLGVSNNGAGQAIAWKDGVAVVTNNSAANLSWSGMSVSSVYFCAPSAPLTATWERALSALEHAELQRNPWQLFKPRPARFFLIPSAGNVTFKPYWARSRSIMIGSGV